MNAFYLITSYLCHIYLYHYIIFTIKHIFIIPGTMLRNVYTFLCITLLKIADMT